MVATSEQPRAEPNSSANMQLDVLMVGNVAREHGSTSAAEPLPRAHA
jgi:hypothetical protein